MRRLAIILVAVFAALATSSGTAVADGTYVFGPYTVDSPDSGSCGNTWANVIFTRRFLVQSNADGSYRFKVINTNGTFTTIDGPSPGACNSGLPSNGHTIRLGVTGQMNGTLEGTVSGGTLDPSATCGAPCYMSVFIAAFFKPAATGPGVTFSCFVTGGSCQFRYEYSSGDKDLLYRHWTNASAGNSGDIASQ